MADTQRWAEPIMKSYSFEAKTLDDLYPTLGLGQVEAD